MAVHHTVSSGWQRTIIVPFLHLSIETRSKRTDANPACPGPLSMQFFDVDLAWILNVLGYEPIFGVVHQAESCQWRVSASCDQFSVS